MNKTLILAPVAILFVLAGFSKGQEAVEMRHRWEIDPLLGGTWKSTPVLPPQEIDTALISSPSIQQRLSGAQSVVLQGRLHGVKNREETFAAILQQLAKGESNRHVLLAMLSAAASLVEEPSQADPIWQAAIKDAAAQRLMEPRFVRWKSKAPLQVWRERLDNESSPQNEVLVAVEGVGAAGDETDQQRLEKRLRSDSSLLPVRLASSKALGNAVQQGLEPLAQELLGSDLPLRELMAANLLSKHKAPDAGKQLYEIAQCDNPPAQLAAYKSLAANFPRAARKLADTTIAHPDSAMRLETVKLLSTIVDPASLNLMASAISDQNTTVRRTVRAHLFKVAKYPDAREIVDDVIAYNLTSDKYEGIEQAMVLAGLLEASEWASQIIGLLEHPNPVVNVRAGWALQQFPEISEEDLARIHAHCEETTKIFSRSEGVPEHQVARIGFCIEALGRQVYKPATEMLLKYVPKSAFFYASTRSSAIYALGYIFEKDGNPDLARELERRLHDNAPNDPEEYNVRYVSCIAMGRMLEPTSPSKLRNADQYAVDTLDRAAKWALEQYEEKGARER